MQNSTQNQPRKLFDFGLSSFFNDGPVKPEPKSDQFKNQREIWQYLVAGGAVINIENKVIAKFDVAGRLTICHCTFAKHWKWERV